MGKTKQPKARKPKKHVSWITVNEQLVFEPCVKEDCCQGLVHCPLCLSSVCPPQKSEDIEDHFKTNHLNEAVKSNEFVVMVCRLHCGVLKVAHYHCPLCGLMLKTANSMKNHLQCNCVITKVESASNKLEDLPHNDNGSSQVEPVRLRERPAQAAEHCTGQAGQPGRLGGKPAGQSIWETQVKIQPNPKQREERERMLAQVPYAHASMVFDVTDFDIYRCGTCSLFHCPLCPSETFTPGNPKKVLDHLEKTHVREQVHYQGLKIMKCRLDCLPSRTKIGQSHYHCPLCPMKIGIPSRFQAHIECHIRGTNKVHKRHTIGVDKKVRTEYLTTENDGIGKDLIQESVEYRIVSGIDDGGNPVEIEVTIPRNISDAEALDSALQYLLPSGQFQIREELADQPTQALQGEGQESQIQDFESQGNLIESEVTDRVVNVSQDSSLSPEAMLVEEVYVSDTSNSVNSIIEEKDVPVNKEDSAVVTLNIAREENDQVTSGGSEGQEREEMSDRNDSSQAPVSAEMDQDRDSLQRSECFMDTIDLDQVASGGSQGQEREEMTDSDEPSHDRDHLEINDDHTETIDHESADIVQADMEIMTEINHTDNHTGYSGSRQELKDVAESIDHLSESNDFTTKTTEEENDDTPDPFSLDEEDVSISMPTKSLQALGVPLSDLCQLLTQNLSVACSSNKVKTVEKLIFRGSWDSISQTRELISRVIRLKLSSIDQVEALMKTYIEEVESKSQDNYGNTKAVDNKTVTAAENMCQKENSDAEDGSPDNVKLLETGCVDTDTVTKTETVVKIEGEKQCRRSSRRTEGKTEGKYRDMLKGVQGSSKKLDTQKTSGEGKYKYDLQNNLQRDVTETRRYEKDSSEFINNQISNDQSVPTTDIKEIPSNGGSKQIIEAGAKRKLKSPEVNSEDIGAPHVKREKLLVSDAVVQDVSDSKLKNCIANDLVETTETVLKKDDTATKKKPPVIVLNPALYVQERNVVSKDEKIVSQTAMSEESQDRSRLEEMPEVKTKDSQMSIDVFCDDINLIEQNPEVIVSAVQERCHSEDHCPICQKYQGSSREDLLMHILTSNCLKICHRKKGNLNKDLSNQIDRMNKCRSSTCFLCERQFSGINQAKVHYALMMCYKKKRKNPHNIPKHPASGLYMCELCGYKASIPHKVWQHMQRKHLEKEYPCDICNELFSTPKFMELHKERVHMDNSKSMCEHCGKEIYTKYMKRHYNDVHNPNYIRASRKRQEKQLRCTQCPYSTLILDDLKRHMRRQHGERNFHCPVCSSTFAFQGDLNLHMKTIHAVRPVVKCPFCDKQLLKKHLPLHIKNIHENVKSFTCPICGKGLQTNFSLKYHIETHKKPQDRQYKFKCSSCHSGFMNKSVLRDHMNCHTGNRPYQCQMCHKSFRQRSVYHKHLEVHNNVKFMCAFCGLIFASKKAVFDHKEMVHTEPQVVARPPNVCVCGVAADNAYLLARHQEDCTMHRTMLQIQGASDSTDDNPGPKEPSRFEDTSDGALADSLVDDAGNSLISPQEAVAILEQEGSEFMAKEVIQINSGTMLVIQEERKGVESAGNINMTDSETVDNSSYLCGYCNITCQSMDDMEQHMLSLHSGDGMNEVSGSQVVVNLTEHQADSMINTETDYIVAEVGQPDLYVNQTADQSVKQYLVSQSSHETVVDSECPNMVKTEPDEALAYQVLS